VSISDILPYVPIIIPIIIAIIGLVINHLYRKSDKIKRIIIDLIKNFVDPAIEKLMIDSRPHEFEFSDSLNYFFGISASGIIFKRFSKRRPITAWRIRKYNGYCNAINDKIINLGDKAKEQGLIEHVSYVERIVITEGKEGNLLEWTEKYEDLDDKEKDKLLKEKNLDSDIEEINKLLKELPDKSKKLYKKLEKIREKWIRSHYLLESDF